MHCLFAQPLEVAVRVDGVARVGFRFEVTGTVHDPVARDEDVLAAVGIGDSSESFGHGNVVLISRRSVVHESNEIIGDRAVHHGVTVLSCCRQRIDR